MSFKRTLLGSAAGAAFAAGLALPASAQEDVAPINSGNVSLSVGFDVYSQYWFRGIDQGAEQRQGLQIQPYIDIAFDLWSYEDFSLAYYFGTWNSFTTAGDTGGNWYESDIYTGFSVGLPMSFAIDFGYTLLYNPSGGGTFSQEIYFGASYDDSGFWADNGIDQWSFGGFQPYVYVAYEAEGASDGTGSGQSDGTYVELGFEPGFELPFSPEDYPISFSIPVAFGFSLSDFYEFDNDGDGDFDDETFGFASVGLQFGVPLPFIPAEYGSWEATSGITFLFLADELADASGTGDDVAIYGNFGLSLSY
ncbi:MAG: TorF family putative porin [Planctomycetota bacterium]